MDTARNRLPNGDVEHVFSDSRVPRCRAVVVDPTNGEVYVVLHSQEFRTPRKFPSKDLISGVGFALRHVNEWIRDAERSASVRKFPVPCRVCHAKAGERCVRNGTTQTNTMHTARKRETDTVNLRYG